MSSTSKPRGKGHKVNYKYIAIDRKAKGGK